MDEITLIMTALVQGAAKAATDVVPDAYKALRDLLRKRFADKPAAAIVLEKHASDPQTYEAPLFRGTYTLVAQLDRASDF